MEITGPRGDGRSGRLHELGPGGRGRRAARPVRAAPTSRRCWPPRSPAAARWASGCAASTGRPPRSASPTAGRRRCADAVGMMLASRAQIVIFWGDDALALYNDAYRPTIGGKHPGRLGRPGPRELGRDLGGARPAARRRPAHRRVVPGRRTTPSCSTATASSRRRTSTSPTTRSGVADGTVGGVFCIVNETTGRVLGERRLRTLAELGSRLADVGSTAELGAGRRGGARRAPGGRAVRRCSTWPTTTAASSPWPGPAASTPARRRRPPPARLARGRLADRDRRRPSPVADAARRGAGRRRRRGAGAAGHAPAPSTVGALVVGVSPPAAAHRRLPRLPRPGRRADLPGGRPASGRTSRNAPAPPSWPRWTAPRPTSSPTSATSSAPR